MGKIKESVEDEQDKKPTEDEQDKSSLLKLSKMKGVY